MTRSLAVPILGVALLLGLAAPLRAAPPGDNSEGTPVFKETDPYDHPDRKEPSFWHRPSAKTPAAQLELIRHYVQEDRRSRAIRACDALVRKWHDAPEAVKAQEVMARLLEADGDYERAFAEYQYLVVYFAGQYDYLGALEHQLRCADAVRTADHTFLWITVESLEPARRMYEHILLNGPRWEKAPQVALMIGMIRETEDEFLEAIEAYEQVQNRFPGTDAARDAAFHAASCRYQIASHHARDVQSRNHASAALAAFVQAYPLDPRVKQASAWRAELEQQEMDAAFTRAQFYDRQRQDPEAAKVAYREFLRRFPDAPRAKEAAARLQKLEAGAPATPAAPRQGDATHENVR